MKNVFISGGAGFIGSHLVERLLARRDIASMVVYDNFSSGTREHLSHIAKDKRWRIIEADIKDLPLLTASMAGADTVIHLAANPDIAKAVTQPDIDFWEGTYLLQNVIEAMRVNGVRRILYTSGSGVYGENPSVAFPEDHGPCLPISTYAASKLACESLICAYCHMFDITARVFRFANVVGPRQTHGVGYDFVRRLNQDPTRLHILGDGSQTKSYIHVDDILHAVFLANELCTARYDVFNVATDDYITVKQIADMAVKVCGLQSDSVHYEFTGGDRGWKGDVPSVRFDCKKIKALGWTCQRDSSAAVYHAMCAMKEEIKHVVG
ncbi:MAG: NAD-dependent epimerase/dehydratase family protein [Deltaproteobacteria bacterium]|nr:NAD-dependent epimerase/dehydratase family protein [Deltaproteobacteria bacterium]